LADDDDLAMGWLEALIRTYLERDVPQLGFRVPAGRLRRLWTMLAHSQGEPVNSSKLRANLEIDGKTVSHYLDILVDLLLVRRLAPWCANAKKRLVKSPSLYIRDSGLVHRLLGIESHEALPSHPVLGKS
jgi:predicted AAA+ superfamily ATPase